MKRFEMCASANLDLLSPESRARLDQALATAKMSLTDLAGARPWLIGATLEDAGYRAASLTGQSANTVLRTQAIEAGIPVSSEFALEDDVFAWFGAMSPIEEAQFLSFVVDGVLLGRSGSEQISSSWLAGHSGPAAKFVEHERRDYPQLYAKLTADRNRAWCHVSIRCCERWIRRWSLSDGIIWSGEKACSFRCIGRALTSGEVSSTVDLSALGRTSCKRSPDGMSDVTKRVFDRWFPEMRMV